MMTWRWVALGAVVSLCVGFLIYSAASGSTEYYRTVAEVKSAGAAEGEVRMLGVVGPDVQHVDGGLEVHFTAQQGNQDIPVVYRGVVPDIFQPGISVVVDGKLGADGRFVADQLLTKCPSRFQTSAQKRQLG
ncbi:MAG TPA: cytochrome c maturation protein CcmE [Candidatus Dormibacteraeota bacterium]|jgi:cytochrome c-type biogenesis protein CcmE|nr:cytochrome c maturation protein CcmE [Candidatus Dormibacteraeota bacterium]